MSANNKKSVSLERRMQTYPPPKYHTLAVAFAKTNEMRESEAVSFIIKDFFDRMPESERQRILHLSKNTY
jgi:hypothetical protein